MKVNNKTDQIERQTDRQEKIGLFIGEKKKRIMFFFPTEGSTYTYAKIHPY